MSDFSQPLDADLPLGALIPAASDAMVGSYVAASGNTYSSVAATWSNANQAIYQSATVQSTVTVTHLAVYVATSAGNIDVGIYNERGTRLVSSGSTAMSGSNTIQSFDVTDTTLTPGLYWLAVACSSTSAILRTSTTLHAAANGATARARGIMVEASALPLPATATFAAGGANLIRIPFVSALYRTTF